MLARHYAGVALLIPARYGAIGFKLIVRQILDGRSSSSKVSAEETTLPSVSFHPPKSDIPIDASLPLCLSLCPANFAHNSVCNIMTATRLLNSETSTTLNFAVRPPPSDLSRRVRDTSPSARDDILIDDNGKYRKAKPSSSFTCRISCYLLSHFLSDYLTSLISPNNFPR